MPTRCFQPIKGQVARFTRLDACGDPVVGANSLVITGFVKVAATAQYQAGAEYLVEDADGNLCINEQDRPRLKRYDLVIDLCSFDPDLIELATGAGLLTRAGTVDGFDYTGDGTDEGFGLEVWSRVAGADCDADESVYWVWPHAVNGVLGDFNIEKAPVALQIRASTKRAHVNWRLGSAENILAAPGVTGHFAVEMTTTPPPTAECGSSALVLAS